jgi:hypothetical protein
MTDATEGSEFLAPRSRSEATAKNPGSASFPAGSAAVTAETILRDSFRELIEVGHRMPKDSEFTRLGVLFKKAIDTTGIVWHKRRSRG